MKQERRQITFRMFKKYCEVKVHYKYQGIRCRMILDKDEDECCSKNCPIWGKLKKVSDEQR